MKQKTWDPDPEGCGLLRGLVEEEKACRWQSRKKPRKTTAKVQMVQTWPADCRVPGVAGGPGFPLWESGTILNGKMAWNGT